MAVKRTKKSQRPTYTVSTYTVLANGQEIDVVTDNISVANTGALVIYHDAILERAFAPGAWTSFTRKPEAAD